jgi:hypothetical protein
MRTLALFEPIFNIYVAEGRELGVHETLRRCPNEMKALKKRYPLLTVRRLLRILKKQYADRWHEIYQPKPPIASASILEKMRIASSRK